MTETEKEVNVDINKEKIDEIISRGTEDILVKEHLHEVLLSGKQLRVKFGIDPTSPHIHLGRAVPLRKLRAFQELGHQIILIIGDFTAQIADPSDKLEKRPMLTDEEIQNNLKDYLKQINLIVDITKTEIHYNSEWFKNMNLFEIGKLLESFTVQQMSKRRNFQDRIEQGKDIYLVEFMYPAMQGYDSLKVTADVEIGGFDQLFNLKAGRIIQKKYGQDEQDIITMAMLEGTDGRKMSSSWGNVISLLDTKEDMFGKIMSLKDDLILKYFLLCTDTPLSEITQFEKSLKDGDNPKNLKTKLAYEIVKIYHGENAAIEAEKNFEKTFAKGGVPDDVAEVTVAEGTPLVDVLLSNELIISKSEFRRLIAEAGVTRMEDNSKIDNFDEKVVSGVYKIGKRRFLKVKVV